MIWGWSGYGEKVKVREDWAPPGHLASGCGLPGQCSPPTPQAQQFPSPGPSSLSLWLWVVPLPRSPHAEGPPPGGCVMLVSSVTSQLRAE